MSSRTHDLQRERSLRQAHAVDDLAAAGFEAIRGVLSKEHCEMAEMTFDHLMGPTREPAVKGKVTVVDEAALKCRQKFTCNLDAATQAPAPATPAPGTGT